MRLKRTFITSIADITAMLIQSILGFFVVRIYIQQLGSEMNGLILTIGQSISYLNLVEAGIGSAVIYKLYLPLANKDFISASAILLKAKKILRRIGIVFTVLLIIVSFIMPNIITKSSNIPNSMVCFAFILIGLRTSVDYFVGSSYKLLFFADQRKHIISWSNSIFNIISSMVVMILLVKNYNLFLILSIESFFKISTSITLVVIAKRKYSWLAAERSEDNVSLWTMTKDVMVHKVAALIVFGTDTILLSIFTNLKTVSIYGIYNLVLSTINKLLSTILESPRSSFGNLIASSDSNKINKIFEYYENIVISLITIVGSITFLMLPSFINLYVGEDYLDISLVSLFVMIFILDMIRKPADIFSISSGKYKETKYISIIECSIKLVFSIILVNFFSLYGVLLASILSFTVFDILLIRYIYRKLLGDSVKRFLKLLLINLFIGTALIFMGIKIMGDFLITQWFTWVFVSIILSLVFSIVVIFINYTFIASYRTMCSKVFRRINLLFKKLFIGIS